MRKAILAVLVSFGILNADASFACTCALIESYGNLPNLNLKGYKSILTGRVVDWKIGSTQDTAIIKVNHVWRGTPVKTVTESFFKESYVNNCNCTAPTDVQWNTNSLEKGKDYIFLVIIRDI